MDENTAMPGWGEQTFALLNGYLSRRLDIDLSTRLASSSGVARAGTQSPISNSPASGIPTPGGTSPVVLIAGGLAVVAVLYFALRRRG
jgi:hypothetical protein